MKATFESRGQSGDRSAAATADGFGRSQLFRNQHPIAVSCSDRNRRWAARLTRPNISRRQAWPRYGPRTGMALQPRLVEQMSTVPGPARDPASDSGAKSNWNQAGMSAVVWSPPAADVESQAQALPCDILECAGSNMLSVLRTFPSAHASRCRSAGQSPIASAASMICVAAASVANTTAQVPFAVARG